VPITTKVASSSLTHGKVYSIQYYVIKFASDLRQRGTEIRLRNVQLRESASTMVFQQIKLMIQCSRCHNRMELKTPPNQVNAMSCQKCNQSQLVNFRAAMVHQFSSIIGYLDLEGCTAYFTYKIFKYCLKMFMWPVQIWVVFGYWSPVKFYPCSVMHYVYLTFTDVSFEQNMYLTFETEYNTQHISSSVTHHWSLSESLHSSFVGHLKQITFVSQLSNYWSSI
jgi:Zn finger protein HypA/HybF involved in hydrogenase expression